MTFTFRTRRPLGIGVLGLFFLFGTMMSGLSAVMLLLPGSILEPLWRLNSPAHAAFEAMGIWAVFLMIAVCIACATAAFGLVLSKPWGFWTAVTILSINLVGDLMNALLAHDWRTLIGLPIGGAMLLYLIRRRSVLGVGVPRAARVRSLQP